MTPQALIGEIATPVLDLLFPPRCFVCQALGERSGLCETCAAAITRVPEPWCGRCGRPLGDRATCYNCKICKPTFVRCRAWGLYEGVLRDAIHRFKYRDRPGLAEPLGARLADYARSQSAALNKLQFDAVIPVPMHPIRQRQRGYNQAERLARVVARDLGLAVQTHWLLRTRATRPQVGLSADIRATNLKDAFRASSEVTGKTVLLIDDVTTTGSTLNACAATLTRSGATAVYALALAADLLGS